MAKANGAPGTKAEAVTAYLAENPKAKSKDVIAALAAKGLSVSENHVYFIKSKLRGKRRHEERERAAEVTRGTAMPNPAQAVAKVKGLARELGGLKNLKQLVDVLAE